MTKKQKETNEKVIIKFFSGRYPDGKKDNGGRWYPDDSETCSCCSGIRSPSRSFPWSYWRHCRSLKHIKTLLQEHPKTLDSEVETALKMTQNNAPAYMNSESKLLQYMVEEVYGHHKDSREVFYGTNNG
jgi:hypothetical protein